MRPSEHPPGPLRAGLSRSDHSPDTELSSSDHSPGSGRAASTSSAASTKADTSHDEAVIVAGLRARLVAAIIDLALVFPVAIVMALLVCKIAGIPMPKASTAGPDYWLDLTISGDPAVLTFIGLVGLVGSVYLVVFQSLLSRTLGMQLLGLQVISVYGEPPRALRSTLRTLGYWLCAATFNLGFLWIGFDREKRGLHDWLAGTYVIKGTRPCPSAPVRASR